MTEIGDRTAGGGLATTFEMGTGANRFDVYVGMIGGPKRLHGKNIKSGETYQPLCEAKAGEHFWLTMPEADPLTCSMTFYK